MKDTESWWGFELYTKWWQLDLCDRNYSSGKEKEVSINFGQCPQLNYIRKNINSKGVHVACMVWREPLKVRITKVKRTHIVKSLSCLKQLMDPHCLQNINSIYWNWYSRSFTLTPSSVLFSPTTSHPYSWPLCSNQIGPLAISQPRLSYLPSLGMPFLLIFT